MSRVVHTNIWSAYGYARKAGYEGTEEEFEQGLKKSAEAAGNAEESAYTASEAATEADAARDAAAQSAESASTSEGNALEYANSAAQVLMDAQAVAQTVNAKATEAAGSASRAENYAQTATTKASEAATAAGTATTAATSASGSAQAADASATAAAASETNAAASASSASTSAGSASESADDAAESAAAAQAVKDSIPADYSQLSADVTDLKSQIVQSVQESAIDVTSIHAAWEQGSISGTGELTNSATRIRTTPILTAAIDSITVTVISGYKYGLAGYDADGNFVTIIATFTTSTATYDISAYSFIRIYYANTANSDILPSAGADLGISIVTANTKKYDLHDSALNGLFDTIDAESNVVSTTWEQGSLSSGSETTGTTRIRSGYIFVKGMAHIFCELESGYSQSLSFYTKEKVFISAPHSDYALNELYPIPNTAVYARIVLRRNDNSTINPTAASNIKLSADYTKVLEDMPYLSTEFGVKSLAYYPGINLTSGVPSKSATRCSTSLFRAKKGSIISLAHNYSNYFFTIVLYDDNGDFVSNIANLHVYKFESDAFCRLIFRANVSTTDLTPADISAIKSELNYVNAPLNHYWSKYDKKVRGINHGGWYYSPMNSILAYKESYRHGFKWVETDLHFTSDGVCVLIHNDTINDYVLNPPANNVYIADITYAQALEYDFGVEGNKIATLEQVLELCTETGMGIYLDIKTGAWLTNERIYQIVDTVKNYGMQNKTAYIASDGAVLRTIVNYEKTATVGINTNAANYSYVLYLMTGENAVWMNAQADTITPEKVNTLKAHDIPLEAWVITTSTIDNMPNYLTGYTVNDFLPESYMLEKAGFILPLTESYVPTIVASRAENVVSDIHAKIEEPDMIYVDITFDSRYSGANDNFYQMFGGLPTPKIGYAELNCLEIGTTAEDVTVKKAYVSDRLYVQQPISGKKYCISGTYRATRN